MEKAKTFKASGDRFSKIYIIKDVHPSIRAEWKRLRGAANEEKKRPKNVGYSIYLNNREQLLYKNGEGIDKWCLMGF